MLRIAILVAIGTISFANIALAESPALANVALSCTKKYVEGGQSTKFISLIVATDEDLAVGAGIDYEVLREETNQYLRFAVSEVDEGGSEPRAFGSVLWNETDNGSPNLFLESNAKGTGMGKSIGIYFSEIKPGFRKEIADEGPKGSIKCSLAFLSYVDAKGLSASIRPN